MPTSGPDHTTRSIHLSSSLHFTKLSDYRDAGDGRPVIPGQTDAHADNGYGLEGNPTLHALQDSISRAEKGAHTLLYPSGLTALTALSAVLSSGDRWLLPDRVYGPLRRYAEYLKEAHGISYGLYDPTDLQTLSAAITASTKLIHIETPSSVTFEITDIDEVVKIAGPRQILTSADNTWAAGELCQPLAQGIDISILSLTKYPAGYSDVFMGSLTTRSVRLHQLLSYHHRVHGFTVSPFSAMLVSRGLESLKVRLAAQGANAKTLVKIAQDCEHVSAVHYVDADAVKGLSGSNGLFSVELDRYYDDSELEKLFLALKTFKIGESWGGTRSLVLPFQPAELQARINPPTRTIIRFQSGLEDLELQIADLEAFVSALSEKKALRKGYSYV